MFTACSDDKKVVPNFDLGATSLTLSPKANSGTFTLNANVDWNAKTEATWLTISPADGKAGEEITITVTAEANTTSQSRTAKVSIYHGDYSVDFTVTQTAAKLSLYPDVFKENFKAEGESKTLIILADSRWDITGLPEDKWCDVDKTWGEGGTRADTVIITTNHNAAFVSRSVTLTIATENGSKKIDVVQEPDVPAVKITHENNQYLAAKAETYTYNVIANVKWSVAKTADWITLTNATGENNGAFTLSLTENTDEGIRESDITLTGEGVEEAVTYSIKQMGTKGLLIVSADTIAVRHYNATAEFTITTATDWTIKPQVDWLTLTTSSDTAGVAGENKKINITVANNEGAAREGLIKIVAGDWEHNVLIQQRKYEDPVLTVEANEIVNGVITATHNVDTLFLDIKSTTEWTISRAQNQGWCPTTPSSGIDDNNRVRLIILENMTIVPRSETLLFGGRGIDTVRVTINQAGAPVPYITITNIDSLGIASDSLASDGSTFHTLAMESNTQWKIESSEEWCTLDYYSGEGNKGNKIKVSSHKNITPRSANIKIYATGRASNTVDTIRYTVIQKAYDESDPTLTILNDVIAFDTAGVETRTFSLESNGGWTITSSESWCTVSPASGSNDATITLSAQDNSNSNHRSALVIAKRDDNKKSDTIIVRQIGAGFNVLWDVKNTTLYDYLETTYKDADDSISLKKAKSVTSIDLSSKSGMTDLSGLHHFTEMTSLKLGNNHTGLKALDLTKNRKLRTIDLGTGKISNLTTLDLTSCDSLRTFKGSAICANLDFSKCPYLGEISINGTSTKIGSMTSMNISGCSALHTIKATYHQLQSIDMSDCSLLKLVQLNNNDLTSATLPTECTYGGGNLSFALHTNSFENVTLATVYNPTGATSNKTFTIDLKKCSKLTSINVDNCKLKEGNTYAAPGGLTVTDDSLLTTFNTPGNAINTITALSNFNPAYNNFSTLPANIISLVLQGTKFQSITLPSDNTTLTTLKVKASELTTLDISGITALNVLDISDCALLEKIFVKVGQQKPGTITKSATTKEFVVEDKNGNSVTW